ncbi:MAG: hypothetical protein JXA96_00405 [Sedimentisphaerales bacterium]|nr:hypothetical protein [Sedimentisphaerales bacterium]
MTCKTKQLNKDLFGCSKKKERVMGILPMKHGQDGHVTNRQNILLEFLRIFVLIAFMLLVISGCDKSTDKKDDEQSFEIDKKYERGPLTAHIRIDKSKITIADTLLLEIEAAVESGYDVNMPNVNEVLANFGIVDWKNLGDKLDENNNVLSTYQYRLEPFVSGTFPIPAFKFGFYDVNNPGENHYELETEPIDIEVASLLGEQRENLQISGIEGVVAMPKHVSYTWIWILLVVVIVIAVICVVIYFKRKRVKEIVRIFRPAHEIAYERLRVFVGQNLIEEGKIKEFYEGISDILRHYIEHRFDLRAPERTTEEFLYEIQYTDVLSKSDKDSLGEFLTHCDMVKFAKFNPTKEQIQKTFDLVKSFIEKTKSQDKKIDVTETENEETVEIGSA